MVEPNEIRARVTIVLVRALGVERENVTPHANLVADLGAESIDFLDIAFRLEHEFGIKLPSGELFLEPLFQGDPDYVEDGRVTEEGLAALQSQLPHADSTALGRDRPIANPSDLFTVDLLVRYIAWKLGGGEAAEKASSTVFSTPIPGLR